jgi:hypothetical protein
VFVDPYDDPDIFMSEDDMAERKQAEEAAAAAAHRTVRDTERERETQREGLVVSVGCGVERLWQGMCPVR